MSDQQRHHHEVTSEQEMQEAGELEMKTNAPKVYQAINNVQADLAKVGVSKDKTNKFDQYNFRGIDDVYNALAPRLAEHGLCVLPRVLNRTVTEHTSNAGKAMFYVVVETEFDFVSAEDGSVHTIKVFGEAMDRGDKATNKAMSAAFKYAAFQAFCIPTETDDADAESHEVQATPQAPTVEELESQYADHQASIESCATIDDLVIAWNKAGNWARRNNHGFDALEKVKDKMKAKITGEKA